MKSCMQKFMGEISSLWVSEWLLDFEKKIQAWTELKPV